ncbi:MAG: thermosome subunit [ANME-2 cluster archaeon]|nr:thermosome subunit [ANME-2 cluster archaeon]MBC2701463.1 thermosome subunit [ANME-2 cluster archaeon]MBC2706892.1 thermosome subunit [ANME-2 cluster archaeon]MBC2746181.1 thermosome subunit [ANME-2 cluster archaeon]MBC2762844.1 thermosome subunit [ANME-2 cluster archaeon]
MAAQLGGQPITILREGTQRTTGSEAQRGNIMAAKVVASAVRTTLGPKGMDKMLVNSAGQVTITNDGATILDEMDIKHPAAKMVVEVAKTQDDEVGDGTTSAAILTGELLAKAEDLLDLNVHSTTITAGYALAASKSHEILEGLTSDISGDDEDTLINIAGTALTGKGAESSKDILAPLVVRAVKSIVKKGVDGKDTVDIKDIRIERRVEGEMEDTEIVEGLIIDRTRTHQSMPKRVEDARIAILATPIEVRSMEFKSEITLTGVTERRAFIDREEEMIREVVDKVINSGATAVFCKKGVDDLARHYLAKAGLFVIHRVNFNQLKKLAECTNGRIITNLDELTPDDLGTAGVVEEVMVGNGEMIFIRDCPDKKTISIILRGGTEQVVDNLARAMHDALMVVGVVLEDGRVVAGGGSPEIELALRLREYAASLKGREQLAVNKFAEAIEVIPTTLAETSGLDHIDKLVELKSKHEAGDKYAGLNVFANKIEDMKAAGVVEPLKVKLQAIDSASEAASMILRIDDVIAATKEQKGPKQAPGLRDYEV